MDDGGLPLLSTKLRISEVQRNLLGCRFLKQYTWFVLMRSLAISTWSTMFKCRRRRGGGGSGRHGRESWASPLAGPFAPPRRGGKVPRCVVGREGEVAGCFS